MRYQTLSRSVSAMRCQFLARHPAVLLAAVGLLLFGPRAAGHPRPSPGGAGGAPPAAPDRSRPGPEGGTAAAGPTTARPEPAWKAKLTPEGKAKAAPLFAKGVALYDDGSYLEALDKFKEAYKYYPSPKILARMGDCYSMLGRHVEAYEHYERFLEQTESLHADPELHDARVNVRAALERLEKKIARIHVVVDVPGARVTVTGRVPKPAPLDVTLLYEPGPVTVTVAKKGYHTYEKTILLKAGERSEVRVRTLQRIKPKVLVKVKVKVKVKREPPLWKKWWLWTAVGTVAAGLAVGLSVWYTRQEVDQTPAAKGSDVVLGVNNIGVRW